MIHTGDCVEVMAAMEPESVDAIVTDPPYGLEFMGKEWDRFGGDARQRDDPTFTKGDRKYGLVRSGLGGAYGGDVKRATRAFQDWNQQWAEAAYRVAKSSAYLLAFGGTRTYHRLACALEDAGWIIRDTLVWGYASGFPKSKASLKPAWEPIVMARKPGPLRDLAIDACRIPAPENVGVTWTRGGKQEGASLRTNVSGENEYVEANPAGRWPANIVLTSPIFDGGWEGVVGGGEASYNPAGKFGEADSTHWLGTRADQRDIFGYGDSGTYSRFFLIPKADRADREPVLGGQLPQSVTKPYQGNLNNAEYEYSDGAHRDAARRPPRENVHPTVKPTDLMRHLVRLVTPAGGVVLDPFLGSGTTAIAAEMEGFSWIGIEREAEYVAIAEARLNGVQKGLGLSA